MSTRHSQPPQLETLPGMDASTTIALAQSGAGELTAEGLPVVVADPTQCSPHR